MGKKVLFTVLDWGLGHATRSIPVINELIARDCDVVLASDNKALQLLRIEFPELRWYELTSYNVEYTYDNLFANAVRNSRRIYRAMRREREQVADIVLKESVELIITDNRYGSYYKGVPSAIITHQIQFRTGIGIMDRIAAARVNRWLKPFTYLWIPDDRRQTLSGQLSATGDLRKRYIGWLSTVRAQGAHRIYDLAVIISGPEPQRTFFEEQIIDQVSELPFKSVVVRGLPGSEAPRTEGNVTTYDFARRRLINRLIVESGIVLCRSGYSSLMDLYSIGKRALLVPTPGQPEQQYLANRMSRLPQFIVQQQGEIDISTAIQQLQQREAPPADNDNKQALQQAIDELLSEV